MISALHRQEKDAIAIIGMACIYPGAHSPEELWENVLAGRRFFRKAPAERLPLADYFDANPRSPGKTYCDQMAVITDWSFDPLEYRIPPVTFQASDITHWLALSTAAAAVRNSGINLERLDRTRIGVIIGNTLAGEFARSHYLRFRWPYVERAIRRSLGTSYDLRQLDALLTAIKFNYESPLPEITEDSLAGNMGNTITGRICNHFNLGGGAYIVDGACSSSLLAVATACEHLINGNMDMVLTGGVDVSLDPFEMIGFAKTLALATEEIRPYDARANGMLTGEGCGILVLAREKDAHAMDAKIYAVIRGWGYSSDGSGGITAPSVEGQERALRRAYERAGYPISSVDLIEGHGTGTPVGDRVEIEALLRLLGEFPGEHACRIGSVKSNIGHCKAAAGAAGLIKAVMALDRKILPPTANCDWPNPVFKQLPGRLFPNSRGEAWCAKSSPRRASVSAMGFGGSNCHITLEEVNPQDLAAQDDLSVMGSDQTSELVLIAGESLHELATHVATLIPIADRICNAELTDLAAVLAQANPAGIFRLAIVAKSPRDLTASLRQVSQRLGRNAAIEELGDPLRGIWAGSPHPHPRLVALFPGQGSQRLNMGAGILQRYPFVQDLYKRAERAVEDLLPRGLRSQIERNSWAADKPAQDKWEAELTDTHVAQPAIVLSSLSMLQVLEFLGLKPSVSIGHSLGEICALHAAGAYDDETAIRVAALRGKAMASLDLQDPGAMMALVASPDEVQELINPFGSALIISNYNSPHQTVISGTSQAISDIARICRTRNLQCHPLPVSHAFHSSIVAPGAVAFSQSLAGIPFHTIKGSVISTLTSKVLDPDVDLKELLSRHMCQPVRFEDAVLEASVAQPTLWVEIGSGNVLSSLVGDILGTDRIQCHPTDLKGEDSFHLINGLLANAYVMGFPLAQDRLFAHRFCRPFPLDNYAPLFIVNPCERLVKPLATLNTTLSNQTILSSASLLVPAANIEDAANSGDNDRGSLMNWSIFWLSQRTGFPASSITMDTKLRDDLNLDSIKTTQLVIALSQRLHRRIPESPTTLSNVRLGEMIDTILHSPLAEGLSSQAGGLGPWCRTFQMEEAAAPLESGHPIPLPKSGSVMIIAKPECPRALAIASCISDAGLTPVFADERSLLHHREMLHDLVALIVLLPRTDKSFFECSLTEFDDRVEGMATTLFLAFGWPVHWRKNGLDGLYCIVLRPSNGQGDVGMDLEAGSAFCKSLQLEHPLAHIKWISLPMVWSAEQWAHVALHELQIQDDRTDFTYDEQGQRMTHVAVPVHCMAEKSPSLGPEDVMLVTGGAKGITSELAFKLACRTHVKLALLGSSPKPDSSSIAAADDMLQSFQRLDREGIQHTYIECDVTDMDAVRHAVTVIENELGRITGILHGAGINKPRSFRDMNLEDCLRCIRVKARGLYNLLTAIPLAQLKVLHVISSVLGKTGMRSQADYTLANAWLDNSLQVISATYPRLQCLSLGYSVWSGIGMGKRLDWLLDMLFSAGVTPISIEEGTSAYLNLVEHPQPVSTFVITGRLTMELESNLFHHGEMARGRYLEKILRWIPGIEIVAEATLSNEVDLYLEEHVFEGTTIFPGVMAAEAMAEAAVACAKTGVLQVIRNIHFRRPLIIPQGGSLVIRTLALMEPTADGSQWIRVAIRSEADGFQENYCEAECLLDAPIPDSGDLPSCPQIFEPLPLHPKDFYPVPLFQGEFFQHIIAIYKLEPEKETICRVRIPEDDRYFQAATEQSLLTVSPAARDAFFQSGAIGLPPRFLPSQISEALFYDKLIPGSEVICWNKLMSKSENECHADMSVFTLDGKLIEHMRDIILRAPLRPTPLPNRVASMPVSYMQAVASLRNILSVPHVLEIVEQDKLANEICRDEIERETSLTFLDSIPTARKTPALGNLLAAKGAAVNFSRRYGEQELSPQQVIVRHRPDGKPELGFSNDHLPSSFAKVELSLADGAGLSAALIGPIPAGVDIETVEERDADTWWQLLDHDGCALALRLATELKESFDRSATRVWTILESEMKAYSFQRLPPDFDLSVDWPWVLLTGSLDGQGLHFFSSVLDRTSISIEEAVLTLTVKLA
jgi:enediyne polyketide synthase